MIKPLFYSVKFHISGDNRFLLSKGYRFQHDDLVFDSYKQIWNVNRHGHWYQDNTHEPEYFGSLEQFLVSPDVASWLDEI